MVATADPLALLADLIAPPPNPWMGDPVRWTVERAGEYLTDDQQRVMCSVVDNRYTAVMSSHSQGKSRLASRLVAWWLESHDVGKGGEAFVVTTAPTRHQVSVVLWRYVAQLHRKLDLVGYIADDTWKLAHKSSQPEEVAFGRKPADTEAANLSGTHSENMLVIIDEACAVPEQIFNAASSIMTGSGGRILAIGNPDDPSTYFHKICQPGSLWNVIHLDAHPAAVPGKSPGNQAL